MMATWREAMGKPVPTFSGATGGTVWGPARLVTLDDLKTFAVWTENDYVNQRIRVLKIVPYDERDFHLGVYKGASGIVRAKDELDVYRFIEGKNHE